MIMGYSCVMWFVFSICLVYYTKNLFTHRYSLSKMFILSLLFHLPYTMISFVGTYMSYYYGEKELTISLLGLIALLLIYGLRQLYMQRLMDAHFKSAFIFQMLILLTGIIRIGFEDMYLYLASLFLDDQQLFISSLFYKMISLALIYYFSCLLYQKMNVIFFDNKTVVFFFIEYFLLSILGSFESLVLNIVIYGMVIFIFYLIFRMIDQGFEHQKYLKTIEYQNQKIELLMQEQRKRNDVLSKIRHDQRNHMLTLSLLYQQDIQKANEYLQQWQSDIETKLNENQD